MAIYINRDAPESGIASLLALQGTKGDTELVHMTKPEVKMMMDTGLMSMNNETGLPQFAGGKNILASLLPMIAAIAFPPLFGPAIGAALGTSALASSAIATGLGTAAGGILSGEDPVDALTKGLLSGGMSYGAGSLFPETFGYGKGAAGEGVPNQGLSAEAGAGTGYDSWGRNVSEYAPSGTLDSSLPDAFSYGMDQQVGIPDGPILPGDYNNTNIPLWRSGDAGIAQGPHDIELMEGFRTHQNIEAANALGSKSLNDPYLYRTMDAADTLPDMRHRQFSPTKLPSALPVEHQPFPGADRDFNLLINEGMPPEYGHGDTFNPLKSTEQVVSMDGGSTGEVTETSWIDKFRNKLPGSMDEAGNMLVDPKSGVFSKQAMATGIGQLGANLLVPDEPEQLPLPKGPDPYVLRDRDYVYNKKKKSPFEGLTSSQIAALYQSGGNDLRSYQQPSSGSGVFPLKAKSGGGIEDLIRVSEQVGISETPFEGVITGNGHGMQDNVMMPILHGWLYSRL